MPKPPFPHMMPRDVPLFASFALTEQGARFRRWVFDLHVGEGCTPPVGFDPRLMGMAKAITQLRIDAVGWDDWGPTIFECKPMAGLSAFGQCLGYRWFFRREYGSEAKMAIITDETRCDIVTLCDAYDISLHVVSPASPYQILQVCKTLDAGDCNLLPIPR